jgi:D-arabinose 1-dehydrogenase-like Zn-dependent alcohol dehydrogenase
MPVGGATALQLLRRAKIKPGQRVLVYGASARVGTRRVTWSSRSQNRTFPVWRPMARRMSGVKVGRRGLEQNLPAGCHQ